MLKKLIIITTLFACANAAYAGDRSHAKLNSRLNNSVANSQIAIKHCDMTAFLINMNNFKEIDRGATYEYNNLRKAIAKQLKKIDHTFQLIAKAAGNKKRTVYLTKKKDQQRSRLAQLNSKQESYYELAKAARAAPKPLQRTYIGKCT